MRRPSWVTAVAVSVLLGACTGEDAPASAPDDTAAEEAAAERGTAGYGSSEGDPAPEAATAGELPPADHAELAAVFADRLDRLGLELTARSALIDRDGDYQADPQGTHLALYVAPLDDRDDDAYVDGIVEVTAAFADVFDRWPGLASFDVCQELPADDPRAEHGLTVSLVDLTRETAQAIEWSELDLAGLYAATEADAGSEVRVLGSLSAHPQVRQAQRDAGVPAWGS